MKSIRDRQISYILLDFRILKKKDTNELIYKTENTLMVTKGEGWQGGIHWQFGTDRYTMLDNQQGPTI